MPRLPRPQLKLQAFRSDDMRLDFLPFYGCAGGGSKILCTDPAGSTVLCDARDGSVETVPTFSVPKGTCPVSFSVTRADALYVFDRFPARHRPCNFEALIYGEARGIGYRDECLQWQWQWQRLAPPPYFNDPYRDDTAIQSYALLDGGSTLCISAATPAVGTYCFDKASGEWAKAGRWKMPFHGRAQHVPELGNLWFGLADNDRPHGMCVLDLDGVAGAPPRVLHEWQDLDTPEGWVQLKASLVYLGHGRFCITRMFDIGDRETEMTTVIAGVDVVHGDGGPCELQMIKHKSFISNEIQCIL